MKLRIILFFLLFQSCCYGQFTITFHFVSSCQKEINKDSISFSLQNQETGEMYFSENSKVIIPNIGKYELSVDIKNGVFEKTYDEMIEFKQITDLVDTLVIPRILYETDNNPNTKYLKYYNCNQICNGYQVDYFKNGKKRLEGDFVDGKPKWEREYEQNGSSIKYFYDKMDRYIKWEYYDKSGKLTSYFINIYREKNFIQKTYNAEGKLIKSEVKILYPTRKQ